MGELFVQDVRTGAVKRTIALLGQGERATASLALLARARDRRIVAVSGVGNVVVVVDPRSGKRAAFPAPMCP
jgi:hypothetical protein